MRIDIVTLFPSMVEPALGASMLGRARARGLVDIRVVNLRDYATGKHRVTDDYQFGGGGGAGVVHSGAARASAVHAPGGVPWRARARSAAVRRPRARSALAAGAGPVADVAAPSRAPRGGEPDG